MPQILVVEDDPDIADLIRHYLEKNGHTVDALASGAAVMTTVRANRPDLIVLDLMLPGLDGLMVCQALRSDPLTAAVPIIMVTARGDEADRIAGLELGALNVPRPGRGSSVTERSPSTPAATSSPSAIRKCG